MHASRLLHAPLIAGLLLAGMISGATARDSRTTGDAVPPRADAAATFRNAMVVAQEKHGARVGAEILARGGNAVDAAVATGFALAVTYPRAGNLGGGGFMLIHLARHGEDIAIDYRETAPAAATRDMFLGPDGKPNPRKSRDSALAIGVPGTVAGLVLAHRNYGSGRFTLAELIAPAIALARDGIAIDDDTADSLPQVRERLARWPASAKLFLREDGGARQPGERLVQADLAATLGAIALAGESGFYDGPVAGLLVDAIRAAGGIMTLEDLKNYRPIIRAPVRGTYRGYDIVAMPPPSSGGIVLIEALNILEGFAVNRIGARTVESHHLLIEAMKQAYADRAFYLGDPAFIDTPMTRLISKDYADRVRAGIDPARARRSADIAPLIAVPREGDNTTHFSVVDAEGNAVANTYTLNFGYGLGLVAEGTGVLLNNELDDFTAARGAANAFGLVGFGANLPGANKRPLSSMSPTILLKDGKVVLVTGSPGGSRIISAVLQVIVNVIDRGLAIAAAVAAPRLHHQWMPDEVRIEQGFPPDLVSGLRDIGHAIESPVGQTSANSIHVLSDGLHGAADPRSRGALVTGF
jgi:gamma-glutamyltranspeptidase/glutathione hydrolase